MPELPEVERIRRVLEPQVSGLTVRHIRVNRPEVIAYPSAEDFCTHVTGQTIDRLDRRGKFLVLCLTGGDRIVLHLRMTGCLLLTPADYPAEKHTHLILQMDNSRELRFSDVRRFGRFWFLRADEPDTYTGLGKLGLEPTDSELSTEVLKNAFGKWKRTIKGCLLDQSVIAGIGNIYSDEILFAARIRPSRPANSLIVEEWARLAAVIPETIRFFTEKNAITPEEYLATRGQDYRNTPFLRVYGHGGEPCPICGKTLCRTVIGGRSSVFCPNCQPGQDNAEIYGMDRSNRSFPR